MRRLLQLPPPMCSLNSGRILAWSHCFAATERTTTRAATIGDTSHQRATTRQLKATLIRRSCSRTWRPRCKPSFCCRMHVWRFSYRIRLRPLALFAAVPLCICVYEVHKWRSVLTAACPEMSQVLFTDGLLIILVYLLHGGNRA